MYVIHTVLAAETYNGCTEYADEVRVILLKFSATGTNSNWPLECNVASFTVVHGVEKKNGCVREYAKAFPVTVFETVIRLDPLKYLYVCFPLSVFIPIHSPVGLCFTLVNKNKLPDESK